MNNQAKKLTPILLITALLSACGSDSDTDTSGGVVQPNLEEVLPFSLESSDGSVASTVAFNLRAGSIWSFLSRPVAPKMYAIEGPEKTNVTDNNPIMVAKYLIRECQSGNHTYTDNLPPPPVRIGDKDLALALYQAGYFEYHISADNCHLTSKGPHQGKMYIDGVIQGTSNVNTEDKKTTATYTKEYREYTNSNEHKPKSLNSDSSDDVLKKELITVTGNSSSEIIKYGPNAFDYKYDILHESYKTSTGAELTVENYSQTGTNSKENVLTIDKTSYTIKWEMDDTDSGNKLIAHKLVLLGVSKAGDKKTLPKGHYELQVDVISPLVYQKSSNGLLFAHEGSVAVNLVSHNISAKIDYFPDHANIVYTRNKKEEHISVNSNLVITKK